METVFVNSDLRISETFTLQQSVKEFLNAYSVDYLQDKLMRVSGFAVQGGLVRNGQPLSAEEVALLFDQLVSPLRAVESLHQQDRSGARYSVWKLISRNKRRNSHV